MLPSVNRLLHASSQCTEMANRESKLGPEALLLRRATMVNVTPRGLLHRIFSTLQ
jgi:hypothetical protein